jgi:predicted Zn-dependent protease
VGRRVAAASPRQDVTYTFRVVDDEEPNAFALPGGHVFVTRGLLALLNGEDELAGVIGHEIAHVAARHAVQRVSRAAPLELLTGLAAGLTGLAVPALGRVVGDIGEAATGIALAPYSRSQERAADRLGQELAAGAGWDPAGLARFLATLERTETLRAGGPRRASFFDSHPATPGRVEDARAHARDLLPVRGAAAALAPAAFLARLGGIVVGEAARHGVFAGQQYVHPDLDLAVRFPDGWKHQVSPRRAVGAAPDGSALILVRSLGPASDPLEGARLLEKQSASPIVPHTEPARLNGLSAARTRLRARVDGGELAFDITWVVHRGTLVQVVGMTEMDRYRALRPTFDAAAGSVRPLTAVERAAVAETRLRIVTARRGETARALAARARAAWSPELVAAVNDLASPAEPLAEGRPVKVAVREPYAR